MKKPVQFDMDGVLADFVLGFRELAHTYYGLPVYGTNAQPRWDFEDTAGEKDKLLWSVIKGSPDFWFNLVPMASLQEFKRIEALQADRDVYFVTSRPGLRTKRQSETWLAAYGILNPTVVVSDRKGEFATAAGVAYSIEDKAGNAVAISYLARIRSFLIDRPYNRFDPAVLGGSVERVKTVNEFIDIVEAGK